MIKHRFKIGQHVVPNALGIQYGKVSGGVVASVAQDGFVRLAGASHAEFSPDVFDLADGESTFTVTRSIRPIEIPAIDIHRERTRNLGARYGERHQGPMQQYEIAAWSAHLRCLVQQSAQRDAAHAPSVGWDPYGDDL
jgi:hypothetical protein